MTVEGRPAAFATIQLPRLKRGVLAREDGSFRIEDVPYGTHDIKIVHLGCATRTLAVAVGDAATDSLQVELDSLLPRCRSKDPTTPGCLKPNPEERARIGRQCQVHGAIALKADTVYIAYGLMIANPEIQQAERDSFPNAREDWLGGCVVRYESFTEVAYCSECRRALDRWYVRRHH